MAFLLIVICLLLILLGAPLGVAFGALALGFFFEQYGLDFGKYQIIPKTMASKLDNTTLLAIPFFVLSGSLMAQGVMSRRLIRIAQAITSWMPSGLAVAGVLACAMFAAVSGSSPATVVAVGAIMVPALIRAGYSKSFTVGLLTSAGSLGILIPPSIPLVVYGVVTSTSIEKLFLGGLGAGLMMTALFITFVMILGPSARRKGAAEGVGDMALSGIEVKSLEDDPLKDKGFRPWLEGGLALFMPVLILGCIYGGIATATEAAALSVVYALMVELGIKIGYKEGGLKQIYSAVVNPSIVVGTMLLIVAMSQVLNIHFASNRVPESLASFMTDVLNIAPGDQIDAFKKIQFLILLNLLLLVVGCLMDVISAILVFVPLILPTARILGIDPVYLGTLIIVNLEIGYLTPPIGLNLFVSSSLFNQPVLSVLRWVAPFVAMMLAGLLILMVFPQIITYFPDLYGTGPKSFTP